MNTNKQLTQNEINELVLQILELPLSESLVQKFTLNELEQALGYYTSKRQILIESKEAENDGFQIEKINGELSGVKVETVKINKAIAELIKKPKKPKIKSNISDFTVPSINQTVEEKALIQGIKDCRTIPDIIDKFELGQIQYARIFFKALRQSVIDGHKENPDGMSENEFNVHLRTINNEISRTNKAISMKQQSAVKAKRENSDDNEESSYKFLLSFFNVVSEQLDSVTLENYKSEAKAKLISLGQGDQNE